MFQKLPDYLEWANRRTYQSLSALSAPPPEALSKLHHLLAAEGVWLSRLCGEAPSGEIWPGGSLAEAAEAIARNVAGYRSFLQSLDPQALEQVVEYCNSKGERFRNSLQDILMHVIAHGNYHRGQIAMLVKGAGGTPAVTDYVFFARGLS